MKYLYYPGCSLHSTAKEYGASATAVASELGIELVEINDWTCCGATPAHITTHILSIALPVRNLLRAKAMGSYEVVTCCAACFSRLKIANALMRDNPRHRAKVNEIVGEEYQGEVRVRHLLDVIVNTFGLKSLSGKVTRELGGLKVACYYGCLLTRPSEVTGFDDLEEPHSMDDLMEAIGAEVAQWPYKTECCGASFALTRTEIVLKLCRDILQMASDEGAEMLVVACPLCQSNLDTRQGMINKKFGTDFKFPLKKREEK